MRKKLLSILLAITAGITLAACSETPVMPEPQYSRAAPEKPGIGENFYGAIDYDYLSHEQIPYGRNSYSKMDSIGDNMSDELHRIIDKCVKSEPESGSIEEMIKEIYLQYTDADGRNKAGIEPLLQLAGMIEQCRTVDELVSVMGFIYQNCGVCSFIKPDVIPDSYDTSRYMLHLMNMNTLGNMKENFTKTDAGPEDVGRVVYETLSSINTPHDEAKQRAKNTVKFLNEIMIATMDYEDMMNVEKFYNLYDKSKLRELFTNIDTENMLRSFGYDTDKLIVFDVSQAKKINELLTEENIREIKDYMLTCIMFEYSQMMPPSYSDQIQSLSDFVKDPDKAAKQFIFNNMEHELGILYGREFCTDEVMKRTEKMVSQIRTSLRGLISDCDRLSDDAKSKYLKKLDNINILLGYEKDPNVPFTITPARDGGNLIENIMAIKSGRTMQVKNRLGKVNSRNEWEMSAIEVNATYYPSENKIEIPAVMMSKDSIDPDKNEFYNLGILGYVIGHEISHAFDSNGYKYDDLGNYSPDWISKEDHDRYEQLMDKVTAYYDSVKLLGMYSINGKQTLSENIADLSSVQCLLNITDNKEELQQIFEGIAAQWASLTLITDLVIQLDTDPHSPGEARTNAVVAVMDKFYQVYDIKETDKMYVAPENRIKVW